MDKQARTPHSRVGSEGVGSEGVGSEGVGSGGVGSGGRRLWGASSLRRVVSPSTLCVMVSRLWRGPSLTRRVGKFFETARKKPARD